MPSPVHHSSVQGVGVSSCLHHRVGRRSSRTNAPLTGKATWKKKGDCFACDHSGGTFLHLVFPMLSNQRHASPPHAKSLSQGTARVAARLQNAHSSYRQRQAGWNDFRRQGRGTEDRSKSSAPKAKPAKQRRSHASPETERLTRTRPSPRAKKLPCHSREIQSPTWPSKGFPQECPSRHNPSKTSMQSLMPNLDLDLNPVYSAISTGDYNRTDASGL